MVPRRRPDWPAALALSGLIATTPELLARDHDDVTDYPGTNRRGFAQIAVILDDIGNTQGPGERAVTLPGPVAVAILPFTPHAVPLAELAHEAGKDVLLHLPMASEQRFSLGPGGLTEHMGVKELTTSVDAALAAVPHAGGVNNHMGSLLTRDVDAMGAVMSALQRHPGKFFVDSRTTARTVAARLAKTHSIPTLDRDVFLDNARDEQKIHAKFLELIEIAHVQGKAVGIGHPYPETLAVLERILPTLAEHGVELVSVSSLLGLGDVAPPNADKPAELPAVSESCCPPPDAVQQTADRLKENEQHTAAALASTDLVPPTKRPQRARRLNVELTLSVRLDSWKTKVRETRNRAEAARRR